MIGGFLAQWAPAPLTLPYLVFVVALGLALFAVARAPETRAPVVPRPAYRVQRVSVPEGGSIAAALAGAFLAFGTMGLFTGLAGTFLAGTLHNTSHAVAGLAVAAVFGGGVAAQALTARWSTRGVLGLGLALMPLGLALVVVAGYLPSLALFLVRRRRRGRGSGRGVQGRDLDRDRGAAPAARAEALAGLFLSGYLGLSVPVLGAGVALQYVSASDTLLGFAVIVSIAILAAAPRLVPIPRGGRAGLTPGQPA